VTDFGLASYKAADGVRPALVIGKVFYDLDAVLAAAEPKDAPLAAAARSGLQGLFDSWASSGKKLAALAVAAGDLAAKRKIAPLADAAGRLAPPYRPQRIFAAASNYIEHADEMGTVLATKANSKPYIFMKADSSVVGPDATVIIPPESTQVDWEVELAAIIGKEARHVTEAAALDYVAGYTVINDVSARDLNVRSDFPFKFDWFQGKSFDTFAPLGPWVVPASAIPDPQKLCLRLSVNGTLMQDASSEGMIFTVREQIAYLSSILTLRPGDVIATGTPTGVGMGRGIFLKDGDVMEASIEHIGTLRNPVAAAPVRR
jgi:2-keto-4-pentenoate hydratase/2-oxohepta-3-ene-1,7-dioic acid hydratase in catechol pathway